MRLTNVLDWLLMEHETRLVRDVVAALRDPELAEIQQALEHRVLGPLPEGRETMQRLRLLFDEPMGLSPFCELALREVLHAATAAGWSTAMRTQRALAAIAMAGF
jgi:hypothetical protein